MIIISQANLFVLLFEPPKAVWGINMNKKNPAFGILLLEEKPGIQFYVEATK